LHDTNFDYLEILAPFRTQNTTYNCEYSLRFYPTNTFEQQYTTNKPILYCTVVVCVFFFTVLVFALYDYMVQRRQNLVLATAKHTDAIVSSFFPKKVRERIYEDAKEQALSEMKNSHLSRPGAAPRKQLKNILNEEHDEICNVHHTKPIAELFPESTVLFADIVGFTAWSSVREPSQVFTLLETVYHAFDIIAKRRRVFKVETVGDCYVAVTGLPEPQPDHAVIMARFAKDALARMRTLTKELEVSLGPDTGDLGIRIGLHSGPVTAGVLRGEKSRFQLFGDTVNTASRIESTGKRDMIQVSEETAKLLISVGKSKWLVARDDLIEAKGKGILKTFWLQTQSLAKTSAANSSSGESASDNFVIDDMTLFVPHDTSVGLDEKTQRLIEWNKDVLARLLKQILSRRMLATNKGAQSVNEARSFHGVNDTVLDEVREVIQLPQFDDSCASAKNDAVELSEQVMNQLTSFITSSKCSVVNYLLCLRVNILQYCVAVVILE
jgi:class 3 adenylate cyclase